MLNKAGARQTVIIVLGVMAVVELIKKSARRRAASDEGPSGFVGQSVTHAFGP